MKINHQIHMSKFQWKFLVYIEIFTPKEERISAICISLIKILSINYKLGIKTRDSNKNLQNETNIAGQ